MIEVRQSAAFREWLGSLRDFRARARIQLRIDRAERGKVLVILLCGGDKSSQQKDIKSALKIAKEIE